MTANVFTFKDYGEIKAKVVLDSCDGCVFCLDVCPFKAISLVSVREKDSIFIKRHIEIDNNLCQGCGLCQGTCPKFGVHVEGFSMSELQQKITKALEG